LSKRLKQEKKGQQRGDGAGQHHESNLNAGSIDLALMVDAYHEFDHPEK
jgi:hypothetical protein